MSTANRVIKNTGYLYAKMGITMFISLYTTRLILSGLGATDFGIYNIVGGAISMLGFLNAAMASATQRFMSYAEGEGNKDKQKNIFNISIILHALIAVILALMLVVAGIFFFHGILNIPPDRMTAAKVVYASLVISTLFTVLTVPYEAILNAHENMRYYAIVGILESLLKLSVAFAAYYSSGDKLIVYGMLMACIPFITLTIMRIYCHRHYEECVLAPRRYYTSSLMKEMTSFAGWNFLGTASSMVGNYGIGVVLNHFHGALLNAAYGVAGQINGLVLVFSNNMLKAFNPVITKSEGAGQRAVMIEQSTTASKFSFALFAIFAIPFITEMPFILSVWLVEIPVYAVIFSQLQLVRVMIEQIGVAYGTAINSEGRISRYNQVLSIIQVLPIIFIYILFRLGFAPTALFAVNISIYGILLLIIKVYFAHHNCGLEYSYFIKKLCLPTILPCLIAMLSAYSIQLFMDSGWLRCILSIILGSGIFCLTFAYIGISSHERMVIWEIIDKHVLKIIHK